MSTSINRVELLGHLGQDAETKVTQSGVACTKFSLATNRRWKDQQSGTWKEATDWHRCVLWQSENLAKYLRKGKQIYCEGRLHTRQWDDHGTTRYATDVVVTNLLLLAGAGRAHPAKEAEQPSPPNELGVTDDDVPF